VTLGEFLVDDWLVEIADRVHQEVLKVRTFEGYRQHVRTYVLTDPIAGMALSRVTRRTVKDFYGRLDAAGKTPRNVYRIHSTVRAALSWAVEERLLIENPAKGARKAPKSRAKTPRPWTEEETMTFLRSPAVADDDLRLFWHLLAMTGMRRGEGLALRWDDWNPASRLLTIDEEVVRSTDHGLILGAPKNGESRPVSIPVPVAAEIERHRVLEEVRMVLVGGTAEADGFMFPSETGGMRCPDAVSAKFARVRTESGMRKVRLHDLRHGHASHLIARKHPPTLIAKRLGHKDVRVTLGVYGHMFDGADEAAADALADAMYDEATKEQV
jgi:integrase